MGNRPQIRQSSEVEMLKEKKIRNPPGPSFSLLVPLLLYTYILGIYFPDWLILQVSGRVFTEGEPLTLRCHGWNNKLVYNVLFYQNGTVLKFSPQNSEFTILKTTLHHNGIYHCSAMGKHRYESAGVSITIKGMYLNSHRALVLRTIINHHFSLQEKRLKFQRGSYLTEGHTVTSGWARTGTEVFWASGLLLFPVNRNAHQ